MRRLAEADAFGSLGLSRAQALWHVMELSDDELPLFECCRSRPTTTIPRRAARRCPLGQEVMTDYATAACRSRSIRVALVRDAARRSGGSSPPRELEQARPHGVGEGRRAGADPPAAGDGVGHRVRDARGRDGRREPDRPPGHLRPLPPRRPARGAAPVRRVRRAQGQVVHVMAKRLFDLSHLLARVSAGEPGFSLIRDVPVVRHCDADHYRARDRPVGSRSESPGTRRCNSRTGARAARYNPAAQLYAP